MNHVDLLLGTADVSLLAFAHPPEDVHRDPEAEVALHDSINFVDGGTFDIRADGRTWRFGPGAVFVTTRGMEFSCTHDDEMPTDRCLTVRFAERAVEDLLGADVPPLRPPPAAVAPRQRWLRGQLLSCVPGDEVRLELLAGALFASLAEVASPRRAPTRWHTTALMRRIDRAVLLVESDYARALTLDELARAAGLSRFHFARAFRALTGVPPHRYLTAVRLRHAARRLRDGASVTHTCYDVGFGSLGHFVTTFAQRFGVRPSDVKRGARVPVLRAVR